MSAALGFEDFLEAVGDPKHPQYGEATEWHHGCYGEPFDPTTIDESAAKIRIGDIAKRGAAGKASQAKAAKG